MRGRIARLARGREDGQVLVLFALSAVVLLGMASVAIDTGRFYSERRFLQNAADAAALAAARDLSRGATSDGATATARSVLAANLATSPNATLVTLPPAVPAYADGSPGVGTALDNGIVVSGGSMGAPCDVRVAIRADVPWTFAQLFGFDRAPIGAKAHATCRARILPIAVRRLLNPTGPYVPATSACPTYTGDGTTGTDWGTYIDFFASAATDCRPDTSSGASPRTDPSDANPGPTMEVLGVGSQPTSLDSFRGYIALDIRDFTNTTDYYNGLTNGSTADSNKDSQQGYICGDYPGPGFPPFPDPDFQLAVIHGNNSNANNHDLGPCFSAGDPMLVTVYDGTTYTTAGSTPRDYVKLVGFAVMRTVSTDVPTAWAYAVTPVKTDPNDPALRLGQVPRLVPWE